MTGVYTASVNSMTKIKIANTKALGVEAILFDGDAAAQWKRAYEIAEENNFQNGFKVRLPIKNPTCPQRGNCSGRLSIFHYRKACFRFFMPRPGRHSTPYSAGSRLE